MKPNMILSVTIKPNRISGYLSVGDDPGRELAFVELAALLSDLACATTVLVLADYEGEVVPSGPISGPSISGKELN